MNSGEHSDLPNEGTLRLAHHSLNSPSESSGNSVGAHVVPARRFSSVTPPKSRKRKCIDLIPIVLVDRSALFRAGLRHILNRSRFQVTADCSSLQDVPSSAFGEGKSAVVIGLERELPAILLCIRVLKNQHPELRVVMLRDRVDVDQVIAAIDFGVDSYLLRDEVNPETVLKSLDMVLADGIVVPPGFAKLMNLTTRSEGNDVSRGEVVCPKPPVTANQTSGDAASLQPIIPLNTDLARLSERERLILTNLTLGASNKLIARKLDVAEATVKAHVKNLLRKLQVSNRTQAAMWAISRGAAKAN